MAAKSTKAKKTARTRRSQRTSHPPCLYLGCFYFDQPGAEDHAGRFQMVVEATHPQGAANKFTDRLKHLHEQGKLFDKPATIYVAGLIRLRGSFNEALLVNYELWSGPDPDWTLANMIPEQDVHEAETYGLDPAKDGTVKPFIDFGGRAVSEAIEALKEKQRAPGYAGPAPAGRPSMPMSDVERKARRDAATAERAQRAAEREKLRLAKSAADGRKRTRQTAIGETLAEIGPRR